jgi:hypothetical protein
MTVSKTVRRGSSPWRRASSNGVDPAQGCVNVGEVTHGQDVVVDIVY